MRWNDFPMVRLILPFILGILFFIFLPDYWMHSLVITGILGGLLLIFSYFKKFYLPYKLRYISGGIIYALLFFLGVIAAQFHYPYHAENYYGKYISDADIIVVRVIDAPKETPKTMKLLVEVEAVYSDSDRLYTSGKSILYFQKCPQAKKLRFDDILVLRNQLKPAQEPLNPYAFDYAKYLRDKGIEYTGYFKEKEWKKIGESSSFSLKKESLSIRNAVLKEFKKSGLQSDEYAVASSLILGYRDEISEDLVQAYRSAGVMHILCVSGMHVGIIYLIISNLLGFLKRKKWGQSLRLVLILINVWGFALITGLSPSVTRAAVMFSFVSVGQNIGRKINIYNTLAASAFFTLIIAPYSLFDIGFLLSYAAVISIASLYKPIYSLWLPYNKIVNFFWQIAVVSLAAQIGTAPFSMYFFHQFPNYFLVSNLVVITAVTPIFYFVLASLIFSFFTPLAEIFAFVATYLIRGMNWFVTSVQNWPFAVTENIHFSLPVLWLIVAFVMSISLAFLKKKKFFIYVSYLFIIAILGFSINESITQKQINRMVAFHTNGHTTLLLHHGNEALLFLDSMAYNRPETVEFQTVGYLQRYGLKPRRINLDRDSLLNNWVYKRKDILVFNNQIIAYLSDTKNIRYNKKLTCNYLIFRDKRAYRLPDAIAYYKSNNLILSGELWPKQIEYLKQSLQDKGFSYYDLKHLPALVVDF